MMDTCPSPLTLALSPRGRGDLRCALTRRLPRRPTVSPKAPSPLPLGDRGGVRGSHHLRQNNLQTSRARSLRQSQTEAEKRLWFHLRNRRLDGLKFRRQVPLGPYIADFYCAEAQLIIEADGGQHAHNAQDNIRDASLSAAGFHVLRFWNSDILSNTTGVLARIRATAKERMT